MNPNCTQFIEQSGGTFSKPIFSRLLLLVVFLTATEILASLTVANFLYSSSKGDMPIDPNVLGENRYVLMESLPITAYDNIIFTGRAGRTLSDHPDLLPEAVEYPAAPPASSIVTHANKIFHKEVHGMSIRRE